VVKNVVELFSGITVKFSAGEFQRQAFGLLIGSGDLNQKPTTLPHQAFPVKAGDQGQFMYFISLIAENR
jgi:hypothetical protein